MSHSIAFINQKGGVGKTTLVANAGAWWGRQGHRVLLIDLDPQAHLTLHFHGGIDEEKRDEANIYRILRGESTFAESVQPLPEESLDLIPSHIDLSAAEWELGQEVGREVILRDKLRAFLADDAYDVVLIDCPPSLGLLSLNALAAVDEVVVPVQAEFFALLGMAQLMRVIDLVRSRLHPDLAWRVVVPTLVDLRTNLGRDVIGELEGHVPGLVTDNWLTKRVKVAEAPSHGMSIFSYAGDTPAADEFRKVCDEIAVRIELPVPSPEMVAKAKAARLAAVAKAEALATALETTALETTALETTVLAEGTDGPTPDVAIPEPVSPEARISEVAIPAGATEPESIEEELGAQTPEAPEPPEAPKDEGVSVVSRNSLPEPAEAARREPKDPPAIPNVARIPAEAHPAITEPADDGPSESESEEELAVDRGEQLPEASHATPAELEEFSELEEAAPGSDDPPVGTESESLSTGAETDPLETELADTELADTEDADPEDADPEPADREDADREDVEIEAHETDSEVAPTVETKAAVTERAEVAAEERTPADDEAGSTEVGGRISALVHPPVESPPRLDAPALDPRKPRLPPEATPPAAAPIVPATSRSDDDPPGTDTSSPAAP